MSLLNRMLQDLDARQGVGRPVARLHDDVRPLPSAPPSHRRKMFLLCALIIAICGGAVFLFVSENKASIAVSPVARAETPPVVAVAPPALVPERAAENPVTADVPARPAAEKPPVASSKRRLDPPVATVGKQAGGKETMGTKDATVGTAPLPAPSGRKIAESEKPTSMSAPLTPDAVRHGKTPAIEKSDIAGSPRERAENEYRKALGAINQGRVADGIGGLRVALREDAAHAGARQLLVRMLLEARQGDEAMQALREGVQVLPAQSGWAMTLARMQVERGDFASAAQTLEHSMPAGAASADYQGFAGHVMFRLGQHRQAAEHYAVATGLAPRDGRWWLGLGLARDAEGRVSEAREAFLRAKASGTLSAELSAVADQHLR